ncbi:MAG: hypothetical protein LV480_04860 [Methylacidiphilales bacterium]|nr:hypothetical protein [Candidatus Methylacidiphilales bacterium]
MSNRELVIDLINKLPADTPLSDIAREIEFVAGVREAIAQSDQGEGVSVDEARRLLKVWTAPSLKGLSS